jgi:hypothetical protein
MDHQECIRTQRSSALSPDRTGQEAWWRIFRRHALAGQTFADPTEIIPTTDLATAQLNTHAKPWLWGRPPSPPRPRRRRFTYLL